MAGHAPLDRARRTRYERALDFAAAQTAVAVERYGDFFPIFTTRGSWKLDQPRWTDWTGGFWAGLMWTFFRRTGEPAWRQRAEHFSRLLEPRKFDRQVHDLGFIFLNSYRPWFELTGDAAHQRVLVQAGRTLAERFQAAGGYLRSFLAAESLFIDIMMNVPVVFYAAQVDGDERLLQIATAHCHTTRRCLVRPDGSTAHEGLFDPQNGAFLRQSTQQGLRADSCWARGLAWSLYGFTTVHAQTGNPDFLATAESHARYWQLHLPADGVPYWDFQADPARALPWGPQRDSSAAAIAASGLWDLAAATRDAGRALSYRATALAMLDVLAEPDYLASEVPGWEGVLRHGVYHTQQGLGVDESVLWGDFFFVEALSKVLAG